MGVLTEKRVIDALYRQGSHWNEPDRERGDRARGRGAWFVLLAEQVLSGPRTDEKVGRTGRLGGEVDGDADRPIGANSGFL